MSFTVSDYSHTGFTLIELLVVVSILSSIAYLAVDNLADSDAQNKWELTDIRLQTIRRAIIGDSGRVHNGKSELSGFVVDLGRLPKCISELLFPVDCEGVALPQFSLYVNNVAGGWRGPYLNATHQTGGAAFRDGWGNKNVDPTEESKNFGWDYEVIEEVLSANIGNLIVQSIGLDRSQNPALADDYALLSFYERDYPPTQSVGEDYSYDPLPLIVSNHYQIPITQYDSGPASYAGALWVDMGILSECENGTDEFTLNNECNPVTVLPYSEAVCLKIASVVDGVYDANAFVSRESVTLTLDGTRQLLQFKFGDEVDTSLMMGRHSASLHYWDTLNSVCTDDTIDFNASFDASDDGGVTDDDVLEIPFVALPGKTVDILDGRS